MSIDAAGSGLRDCRRSLSDPMLFISWQAESPDSFETGGSAKIMPQIRFAGRTQKNCSDQPATSTGLIGVGTFLRSDG